MRRVFTAAAAMFIIGCGDTIDKTAAPLEKGVVSDTTVDAKTSASKKIKVTGGLIYADSAVIDFWYMFQNGYTWAKVIDSDGKTVLCDTLNMPPFEYPELTDTSHKLKPLTPATEYRLIVDGIYWEDANQVWTLDTITFRTREK